MEDLSYYEILEVDPNADEEAIRKAYRRQAIRWHPDKNKDDTETAEAMFKNVAEAYEVLSNSEKRRKYDFYGKEGLQPGHGQQQSRHSGHAFNMNRATSLFEEFFASDPFFSSAFGRPPQRSSPFGVDPFESFFQDFGVPAQSRNGMNNNRRNIFDDFLEGGMEGMGGFNQGGFGGGVGRSTRTVTQIINGRRVTKTETTIRHPDGRVETIVDESDGDLQDAGNNGGHLQWF